MVDTLRRPQAWTRGPGLGLGPGLAKNDKKDIVCVVVFFFKLLFTIGIPTQRVES